MEKYSRWRDAGTGIQPFLPPVAPRTDSNLLVTLSNVVHLIVGPIQGIVKIVFVLLFTLLYGLFVGVVGTLLTPIAPLKRVWDSLFSFILLRSILFFTGFFHIKTETVSVRKSRNGSRPEAPKVKSGDVIVSNWTSYIDVIYLAAKFNPVFTQLYIESDKVKVISLWEAIRLVSKVPESKPSSTDKIYSLQELSDKATKMNWGPIVVFAEGTTSNGRALLKFLPVFKDYKVDQTSHRFRIVAFKYEFAIMPPTYTVGNQFFHYFKLCSQFHNTLLVKTLSQSDSLSQPDTINKSEDSVGDALISSLGNISKLRKTNLGMSDKRDFLYYYKSRTEKK